MNEGTKCEGERGDGVEQEENHAPLDLDDGKSQVGVERGDEVEHLCLEETPRVLGMAHFPLVTRVADGLKRPLGAAQLKQQREHLWEKSCHTARVARAPTIPPSLPPSFDPSLHPSLVSSFPCSTRFPPLLTPRSKSDRTPLNPALAPAYRMLATCPPRRMPTLRSPPRQSCTFQTFKNRRSCRGF